MFACRSCWFELPREVRGAISSAYASHGALSVRWCAAARGAFAAWGMASPRWLDDVEEERA
jgi:hypothetical protein